MLDAVVEHVAVDLVGQNHEVVLLCHSRQLLDDLRWGDDAAAG